MFDHYADASEGENEERHNKQKEGWKQESVRNLSISFRVKLLQSADDADGPCNNPDPVPRVGTRIEVNKPRQKAYESEFTSSSQESRSQDGGLPLH